MTEEATIEIGDLYANLHEQFSQQLGEDYEQAIRQEMENFLHKYNQQLDRHIEQADQQQEEPEIAETD